MDLQAPPELEWGRQASESAVAASFLCQATPATSACSSCLGKPCTGVAKVFPDPALTQPPLLFTLSLFGYGDTFSASPAPLPWPATFAF